AQDDHIGAVVAVVERDVSLAGVRVVAPEHDDAAALRLLAQILAELQIAARAQFARSAIAGKTQAGTDERGTPRRLVILDLGMTRHAKELDDGRIVDRAVDLGDTFEMGCNRKPRSSHGHPPRPTALSAALIF